MISPQSNINLTKAMPKSSIRRGRSATFITPMQCLAVAKLPTGPLWTWEIKLDGYRAEAVKSGNKVTLYSRLENSLNVKHPYIVEPLAGLPDDTVVDGELVALGDDGRPNFHMMQKFRNASNRIHYYIFDLLILQGRDLTGLPLAQRRNLLKSEIKLNDKRIRIVEYAKADSKTLLITIKKQRLEGIIGKRADSVYESGERSGAWIKHRLNSGQELVIGGYTPGGNGFDALIVGYYAGKDLRFVAKVRNGFMPETRREIFKLMKPLVTTKCPYVNLPELKSGRWGAGLTTDKMKECQWLKPELVAQFEYLEWTGADHLRHAKFIGMRDDKSAKDVRKES
jgi:DNA ligase D-like protein (predicted ligase)